MNNETETSTNQWDLLTRVLHWISAIWVSGLIGLGLIMVNLVHASGLKFELFQLHKSYGFVFGFILIARLVWKLMSRRPKAAGTGLLHKMAVANQNLMLLMLVVLVGSGYALVSFSIIPIPIHVLGWNVPSLFSPEMMREKTATAVHHYIAFGLTALVLVHSCAALFHHFILKDQTLIKMIKKQSV